jgi:hypothetical protein
VLVGRGADQLHVHVHDLARLLHAAFEDVRDAQLARDLRQIVRAARIVLRGGARDHLERADLRQAREDLVLDARGEVAVGFLVGEIFKRQHRDGLLVDRA